MCVRVRKEGGWSGGREAAGGRGGRVTAKEHMLKTFGARRNSKDEWINRTRDTFFVGYIHNTVSNTVLLLVTWILYIARWVVLYNQQLRCLPI